MMKKILQLLFEHKSLDRKQAHDVLTAIGNGQYNEHEITSFMTVYLMRSITIDELHGFRDALLELCILPGIDGANALDIVGTGGDGKNTFNISTLACFICAGAGQRVIKHGNYGSSSISGSSNVMEELGYRFTNNSEQLQRDLERANICFLHAPLFHPALKTVGHIRKNLAMRTFFNMLGPLANPVQPASQLIGVYNLEMARIYNYFLQEEGRPFTILHSLDGYDEISLTNDTKVIDEKGEHLYTPEQLGKRRVTAHDICGGNSVTESAAIFKKILSGDGTWAQNAVVLANAAMALYSTRKFDDYEQAYQSAVDSLENGKAMNALKNLLA